MFKRILVPLDGSSRAERAVPVAARLARASGGSVVLIEVFNPRLEYAPSLGPVPGGPVPFDRDYDAASTYLQALTEGADLDGIATETRVLAGMVPDAILAETRVQQADAIVMTSHGRTGFARWVLGSVAQRVVRRAPVPVILLRDLGPTLEPSAVAGTASVRVLVPLDGSPLAEAALLPAIELAHALAGPRAAALHLLRIPETPAPRVRDGLDRAEALDSDALQAIRADALSYLSDVAERLRRGPLAASGIAVTSAIAFGEDPARAIVELAEGRPGASPDEPDGARACDVIAMATHGRGGLERLALGSVTERVIDGAHLPMLITRPPQAAEKQPVPQGKGEPAGEPLPPAPIVMF